MADFIFDIDGTIADNTHRTGHITPPNKNWAAYNSAMHLDKPIWPTIETLRSLKGRGNQIILATGREAIFREVTISWLRRHSVVYNDLYMRREKDYRADQTVKSELLDQMIKDGYKPKAVFDDRGSVIKMWKERGLTVFAVNGFGGDL